MIGSILSDFQTGYIDQLDFVKQYQPKAITISIGGNDIGFSSRLQQCLGTGTCYSTYEDRLEFVHEANHAFPKLVNTYTKIRNSGAADARIYVIGYPQIALPGGNCAVNVHMNNDELVFAEQAIDYLDSVIAQAASKAGVFYIDARDAFFGHRLCEAGPGSVAVNGITAGNDFPDKLNGPIGRESYHPNAFGHLLLENRILAATHNLTSAMPNPDLTATLPTEKDLEILNVPHSGHSMNTTEFDPDISADLAYQQVPLDVSVDGTEHSLAPNTTLQAELHSIPLSLGSFKTDINGNLNAQVKIPTGIPVGYHALHFYGTDITGQAIDIYKVIYIASTADDLDGNGILDSTQKCVGIEPANQDYDQDGIDDSCDGKIDQSPVQTPISVSVATTVSSSTNSLVLSSANNSTSQINNQSSTPSQNTKPIVLAAVTSNSANQIKNDNLNIPAHYYAIAAVAFLALSTLYYCLKRWLF
jgi:lysophospholipase L1-like esterase